MSLPEAAKGSTVPGTRTRALRVPGALGVFSFAGLSLSAVAAVTSSTGLISDHMDAVQTSALDPARKARRMRGRGSVTPSKRGVAT